MQISFKATRLFACAGFLSAILSGASLAPATAADTVEAPELVASGLGKLLKVEPAWPKTLPNNWIVGQIGGLWVDDNDHIWVLQRPRSNTPDEAALDQSPPISVVCCHAAPPVLEFDKAGNLLRAFGGPVAGARYTWPTVEHGIYVDHQGFVWIGGNGTGDSQILKFKQDGTFVAQFGTPGINTVDSNSHCCNVPGSHFFKTAMVKRDGDDLYVADGYGNHRIIVINANTGAYERSWGAFGQGANGGPIADPVDGPYNPGAAEDPNFRNPVHCVLVGKKYVYVCDRTNNRLQVFTKAGKFVREKRFRVPTLGPGAVWDLTFYRPLGEQFILLADGTNQTIEILAGDSLADIGSFGHQGRNAGQFHWVHVFAVDSEGSVYEGEVDTGKRLQKFSRKS